MKNVLTMLMMVALISGSAAAQSSPGSGQSAAEQSGDSRDVNRADNNYWGLLGLLGLGGLLGLRRRRDNVSEVDRPSGVRRAA
jgi:LPXTG-motif cell wall-anchored protein